MRIQYKSNPKAPFETWLNCSKKKKRDFANWHAQTEV